MLRLRAHCLLLFALCLWQPRADAHSPAQEMSDAANNFLAALDPSQKTKAVYEFGDAERFDWHFVPKARKGLPLKEMTPAQRALAQALLSSGLSPRGFAKASTIMSLEEILFDIEGRGTRNTPVRDAQLYFFTVFGKPGSDAWGWRVEGHHLSLNFAVSGNEVVAETPSFFGSNPGRVLDGPRRGLRVLGHEEDLGRDFANALTDSQRAIAVITNVAPREIITGNARKAHPLEPMGICSTNLSADQNAKLAKLTEEFVFRYRPEIAASLSKLISTNASSPIWFAWAGSLEPGKGHYYRIQSSRILIEYDNTQNDANHIHTVVRDLANDFGDDVLARHYQETPHSK